MSRESRKKDMVRANTPSDLNTGGGGRHSCVFCSLFIEVKPVEGRVRGKKEESDISGPKRSSLKIV